MSDVRPRIPCPIALGAIGVPAKRWATRADLIGQLEVGRRLLESDPAATVEAAALAATMSPEHFLRMFQETFGQSPRQYAAQCRLDRAASLLQSSTFEIWHVAQKCGYADASAFSRAFRRRFGVSPRIYRSSSQLRHSPDSGQEAQSGHGEKHDLPR